MVYNKICFNGMCAILNTLKIEKAPTKNISDEVITEEEKLYECYLRSF